MRDVNDILAGYKRIVVKISSGLLVDDKKWELRIKQIRKLANEITSLSDDCEVVIISSGAIGVGRSVLGFDDRNLKPQEKRAAAAAGQMELSKTWGGVFAKHEKKTAQMLLTLQDTEEREQSVNIGKALAELLNLNIIPIINENNTVTRDSSYYGDNDRLAARVAIMVKADLVLLLGDIDGLYDSNPEMHEDAVHIPVIKSWNDDILSLAEDTKKLLTSGGMATKLQAARIAAKGGVDMIIAKGEDGLESLRKGKSKYSLFKAEKTSLHARKKWIGGALRPAGSVTIDNGAAKALLENGKSLLPAGVKDIAGDFKKGDTVDIIGLDGRCAIGLAGYDSDTARQIMGKKSKDVESILGTKSSALIHRNDLVIL